MKKALSFVFLIVLTVSVSTVSFSQEMPGNNIIKNNVTTKSAVERSSTQIEAKRLQQENTDAINRLQSINTVQTPLDGISPPQTQALVSVLPNTNATSGNGRAPQGSRRFVNTKYIISGSEMLASAFTGAVTSVGWTWNGASPTAQSTATTGNIRVYLKDTSSTATTIAGTFIDTNGVGYTKVIDGTISIPATSSLITIDLPVGGPGTSAYTPTPGSGVIVIFVYKTIDGTLPTPLGSPTTYCSTALPGQTLLTYQNQTVGGSTGAASSFRPETRFGGNVLLDIVSAGPIYTYGEKKVNCIDTNAVEFIFTHKRAGIDTLDFNIYVKNLPSNVLTDSVSFFIALNDTGSSTTYFTTLDFLKTLDLLTEDSLICKITTRAVEQVTSNNRSSTYSKVGMSSYNQAITGAVTNGGVGYGSNPNGTSELATAYDNMCTTTLTSTDYILTAAATSQSYRVRVYGDNAGIPGTLLFDSPVLSTPIGTAGAFVNVRYRFNTPIVLPPGRFYISIVQMALATNIGLGYQAENPVRFDAFFSFVSANGGWSDVGGSTFKLNMRANTESLSLTGLIQGLYDSGSNTSLSDTITVKLRNSTSPYAVVSTDRALNNSNGVTSFTFSNLTIGGSYYIDVSNRNILEVWSNSPVTYTSSGLVSYDFTTASSQGYGSTPLVQNGSKWCFWSGDVNQDQAIDASDLSAEENGAANSLTGYVPEDVNGDDFVDAADQSIVENNKDLSPFGEYP